MSKEKESQYNIEFKIGDLVFNTIERHIPCIVVSIKIDKGENLSYELKKLDPFNDCTSGFHNRYYVEKFNFEQLESRIKCSWVDARR